MSNSLSLLALAVALSAVSAGVTASLLSTPDSPALPQAPLASETLPDQQSASKILAQIEDLRRENQVLRARLATLESRPAMARTPAGGAASMEDLAALEARLRKSVGAGKISVPPPPEFKTRVAEVMTTIRKEQAVAKFQQAREKRASQLEERLTGMTEWLSLDSYQANEMRTILTSRDEREREILAMWQAGVDDQILGDTKRSNADEFRTAVSRVLSPQQQQTFQERSGKEPAGNTRRQGGETRKQ